MKKLLLVFLFISSFSFAQKPKIYIGIKTLHGIHTGIIIPKNDSTRFGFSITYYHAFFNEMYIDAGGIVPTEYVVHGLNQKGIGFGANYSLLSAIKKGKWHNFMLEYQRLESGIYIRDVAKRAGSSEMQYDEFSDKYHNISIGYGIRKELGARKKLELFYEYGFTLLFIKRQYSIEGTVSHKQPSDRIENIFQAVPFGRIGMNIIIF